MPRAFPVRLAAVVTFLALACAFAPGAAADPEGPVPQGGAAPTPRLQREPAGPAESGPTDSPEALVRARATSPMMLEIAAVLENEQARLAELKTRLADAKNAAAFLAIQKDVEKLKLETEVALLRIQATHARREGRTALADRIDAAIEEMLKPVPRGVPAVRPIPTTATTEAR